MIRTLLASTLLLALAGPLDAQSFVNWEHPHVHPLDLSPDGTRLCAVNTADNRVEVFDSSGSSVVPLFDVKVGLDPVSARLRTDNELWVVNHVSDSVSIIDLTTMNVVATLRTLDEPCDVVFAGTPERAFVSCSQANAVQVFDPANLMAAPISIPIDAEDPRAMATSADGSTVYVAIFESGNSSTLLGGGLTMAGGFPPNVVNNGTGPHGGVNPPPNDGASFTPAQNAANATAPQVGLIVKRDGAGNWMDDNGGNWSNFVSGANAPASGRVAGWDMPDRDIAVIDTATLAVNYATGLMNINMALAVNPVSGDVTVVGTDATNEIRFEPVLNGTFIRVHFAAVDAAGTTTQVISDLNGHLNYTASAIPQVQRDQSLGDPRGIAWSADGSTGWVTGMGSNNVVLVNGTGTRSGAAQTIEVGDGPTGIVMNDAASRVYVLNKFEGSISVIDESTELEIDRVSFYDPTPASIKVGRKHLYDTHKNSGLGQAACGSCHVDSRIDRLSWDLGNPAGDTKAFDQNCLDNNCEDFHPMKGPMLTQTLQDIIGNEPFHWRGDKDGLEEFNGAFTDLQGDDQDLTATEMQEYEDFLATIHFPPNPFRNFDNTLPTNMPLPGQFTSGRFGPAGQPLPNGDATQGLADYTPPSQLDGGAIACATCHTLPTGMGTGLELNGINLQTIPLGPNGEAHHALVSVDGSTQRSLKIPHLRNLYDRVGTEMTQTSSRAGFGFLHDGSVDSIARFLSEPVFSFTSDQQIADMVAFMMAFSGSDLPTGSNSNPILPLGPNSLDTHAAVGIQETVTDSLNPAPGQLAQLLAMEALADTNVVGLVVHGRVGGLARGATYLGSNLYQADRALDLISSANLLSLALPGSELTWTIVPKGSETRIGIDRDEDGFFDRHELDSGSDPADPNSVPAAFPTTCNGDGGDQMGCTNCPCMNNATPGTIGGCLNSAGSSLRLAATGNPSVTLPSGDSTDLRFAVSGAPAGAFCILNSGDGLAPANMANPCFGLSSGAQALQFDGLRCAIINTRRHGGRSADGNGDVGATNSPWGGEGGPPVGIANAGGGFAAGQTRFFQIINRDDPLAVCMRALNTSQSVEVTFTP